MNWDKSVPEWCEIEDLFIVGGGFPKRYWNCEDSEVNVNALKEIFSAHKIKFSKNSSFNELKNLFKETFRKVELSSELNSFEFHLEK